MSIKYLAGFLFILFSVIGAAITWNPPILTTDNCNQSLGFCSRIAYMNYSNQGNFTADELCLNAECIDDWSDINATYDDAINDSTFWNQSGNDLLPKDFSWNVKARTVEIDQKTEEVGVKFAEVNDDNQAAINLSVNADTSGDDVYGIKYLIQAGTGTATSNRNAYGNYFNLTNNAESGGSQKFTQLYGHYMKGTVHSDWGYVTGYYAYLRALGNEITSQARGLQLGVEAYGNNSWVFGQDMAAYARGHNSIATGFQSSGTASWFAPDSYNQTVILAKLRGLSYDTGDKVYYVYAEDTLDMSHGGTHYGTFINISDSDIDGYSNYVTDESLKSYFGSDTVFNSINITSIRADGNLGITGQLNVSASCNLTVTDGIITGFSGCK